MNCFHKCRLCLKLCENTMDIFKDDFSKLITILTGLTIEPSDGLPTNSCLDCVKNVKLSVRIRDLIIQSHEILFKEYLVHHRIESSEQSTQEKVKTHNSPDPTGIEQSSLNCHKTEQSETLKQEDSRLFEINATQLEEHEEISNLPENRKEKKYKPSKVLKKVAKFKNEAEVSCVKKTSKIKIPPKKVTCTICRREVRSNWIRKHLETHEYNPSTCEYCGLVSKSATALRHHVFYYHKSAENEYMCDQCGKSFRLKYRLNLHKKKEHGGTQDFECTTCGKRFYERLHLKRHVDKTHQNQRPYVCDGCGKGFKSQNHVKIHKRIHSREAPYSCHMCGERFKLQHNDGLPTTSCIQCYQDVKSAITIRSQIINSYQNLLKELKYNVESVLYPIHSDVNNEEYRDQEECSNEDNSSNISEIGESIQVKSEKTLDLLRVKNRKAKFRSTGRSLTQENGKEIKKQRLSNSYSLKVHCPIKAEHQEFVKSLGKKDRVPCPECGRVMFGMNMKNHLITHNYDPVICDICGKSSKNAQALQDHINYYHKTTPDRFMCDKCGKGYRVRFMLERHEKKEHGNGDRDYECSICGKKFFEKLHLKNHINITHKKIKAYKCEHCGKDFGRRTQFVTHQLVHTKENRYHCQVCGKGFKIKQSMQTHLKGVHGIEEEKTIFCKICQKGFATPQGLRAHVNSRVHGLEKCDLCNEYITVEYKNVHLSDIHGIELKEA